MERTALKRSRSEDQDFCVPPQRKTHVNDKIVASSDDKKMQQIHEKTMKLLFKAARQHKSPEADDVKSIPLWQQIRLAGNGEMNSSNLTDLTLDMSMEKRKAECCQRETYVRDECGNCTMPLCEHCGYSCADCGRFLCHSCVAVFGSGTLELPMCERCTFFHQCGTP